MKRCWRDSLALLVLILLVVAFFWPLLSGRYHIPRGGGDLVSFLWPTWRFAARSLRQGVLPLWNPTLYAGMPFAADNQSALFYPPNLLLFLLFGEPGYGAMEALVVFHMALAAVLMLLLLRDKGLSRAASVFGGLAFALSDLLVTHIGNLNLNATIAYLPGVLLLADRAFTRRSARWAAAAGAVLAVSALAGHAQMLLLLAFSLTLLALYRAATARSDGAAATARVGLLAAVVALVGLGGAAVALIPAYELMGHSMRGSLSLAEATRFSLPWPALAGLVVPRFYGRGVHAFWGPWERVEMGYLGVLPLALALGAVLPRDKGESSGSRLPRAFFVLVALAGLALALGANTPLYRLVHALPGLGGLRAPARLIGLTSFGLAGLAAEGLDRLPGSRRVRLAAALALALALLFALGLSRAVPVPPERLVAVRKATWIATLLCAAGLLWLGAALRWPRASWLSGVAVALLALDLVLSGSTAEIDRGDPWQGYRHDDVLAFLRAGPGLFRIDSSAAHAWQPDAAAVHGLYDIAGLANPLGLASYETYRWSIGGRGDPLYSLLGVKYVLADKGSPPGDQRLVPVYTDGRAVDVYQNTTAHPMALLVYRAVQVEGGKEALDAVHAPGFDPTRVIVLQEAPQHVQPPAVEPPVPAFLEYAGDRLALRVSTPAPAYLLLSEVYYPGWQARIDGSQARILQADFLFRAVYVPAGTHEVRLWFSPPSFWLGAGLSLVTWTGLAAWGALSCSMGRPDLRSLRRIRKSGRPTPGSA